MKKLLIVLLASLISFALIGCATTPEEKEAQKNRAIVNSAIQEGKPKRLISPFPAIISNASKR